MQIHIGLCIHQERRSPQENEAIAVGKVNVDEEMELAVQFGVSSIPTLVVMDGGKTVATAVGYRPKADVLKLLDA